MNGTIRDEGGAGAIKEIVISVKSGKFKMSELRDLLGVLKREEADIGVLVQMTDKITDEASKEIASAGFYTSAFAGGKKYPRLQTITVDELVHGKGIECPPYFVDETKKAAKKQVMVSGESVKMLPGLKPPED